MKFARVRPSNFILVTHVIVVSIHIKHKVHIRRRAWCVCVCVCVCVCTNGAYALGLCVYGLRLGFDCFIIKNG
jgi:hypothetical protein